MTDDSTPTSGHATAAKAPLPIVLVLSCTISWVIARGDGFYAGYFRDLDGNKLNAFFTG